jgi:DnaJ-domain-containing protein 1
MTTQPPIDGPVGTAPSSKKRVPMTHRDKDLVRALACVMWADGHPSPKEQAFVEDFLAAYDPTADERRELEPWLVSEEGSLDDLQLHRLTVEDGELLLTNAAVLTHADDVQLPSERAILQKLGTLLGFSREKIEEILITASEERVVSLPSNALEDRQSLADAAAFAAESAILPDKENPIQ